MAKRIKVQDLVDNDNTVSVLSHQLRVNNEMSREGEVKVFNLDKLHPNQFNPRKLTFNESHINAINASKPDVDSYLNTLDENTKNQLIELLALSSNIEQSGLLQPIVVTNHPTIRDEFMVVAGERRYWSHILLGRTVIRAIYRQVDEKGHRVLSIAENLARHDLSLKEKVIGLKDLLEMDTEFTKVDHVMKLFGVRKSAAYMLLKLTKDERYYSAVVNGQISQFRDIDSFESQNNILAEQLDEKIPTVGKLKSQKGTFLKLTKDQSIKLAMLLSIDPEEPDFTNKILEKLV